MPEMLTNSNLTVFCTKWAKWALYEILEIRKLG